MTGGGCDGVRFAIGGLEQVGGIWYKGTNPGRTGWFLCCMFTKHGKRYCHWYVSIGNYMKLFCIFGGLYFGVSLLGKGNDQSFTCDVAIIFYALDSHWTVNHF